MNGPVWPTCRLIAYRLGIGLGLLATFLIVWINLAVGIIGKPGNPANLLYFGVPVFAFVGALIVRVQARGMSAVLFTTAAVQVMVAVVTLLAGWVTPVSWAWTMLFLNGFFTSLWVGSALLFKRAAREL